MIQALPTTRLHDSFLCKHQLVWCDGEEHFQGVMASGGLYDVMSLQRKKQTMNAPNVAFLQLVTLWG